MSATLRPQQRRLLLQIGDAIAAGDRRIMASMPTGGGKTIVAARLADQALVTGKRAIITVPALSLIDQTVEKFYAEGVRDVGVIQADHGMTNFARPIQVASVQTLQRRQIPRADLVLIDEAHRWFDFYGEWLGDPAWRDVPFIGLTATPWTRGLGKHFHRLIIAATTGELIDADYLSKFRVFAPSSPDLGGVRTIAGDYHEGDLSKAVDNAALVADVVATWIERGQGRPTLCFAVDRAHAKHLQTKFQETGITCGYIDCHTNRADRETIAKQFEAGALKVVCNVGCLTTGIDWDVRCIILARPTKSEILFVQMIGRGLRTAEGKADCLILDHSDNHLRLGFVTDIHHEALDDGRERQKAKPQDTVALPKKCPSCSFLKPPKVLVCPCCGFEPKPKCSVVNRDGELVEFTARRTVKPAVPVPERQAFYQQLKAIRVQRGFASGWIANKYREKFGEWPPRTFEALPAMEPSAATRSWVRSRAIAYAKAMEAHR